MVDYSLIAAREVQDVVNAKSVARTMPILRSISFIRSLEGRPDARDVVLRTFFPRDRDHVAGWCLVGEVGVEDAEIGVAVLHVVALTNRLLVGSGPIGVVDGDAD